jgi:hypothetical protein
MNKQSKPKTLEIKKKRRAKQQEQGKVDTVNRRVDTLNRYDETSLEYISWNDEQEVLSNFRYNQGNSNKYDW